MGALEGLHLASPSLVNRLPRAGNSQPRRVSSQRASSTYQPLQMSPESIAALRSSRLRRHRTRSTTEHNEPLIESQEVPILANANALGKNESKEIPDQPISNGGVSKIRALEFTEEEMEPFREGTGAAKEPLEVDAPATKSGLLWGGEWQKRWTIVGLCFFAFLLCNMDRVRGAWLCDLAMFNQLF